jgi:plasmid stabilization system protein ParE
MKPVLFHPEAEAELHDAARWYNAERRGLGREFRRECRAAITRIARSPDMFAVVRDNVRCHLLHRFPYGVLYEIQSDCVFVVAVMHLHRDPDYWASRVEER